MNKEILKLALPNIISNITIPLLGLVDLAILGHLNSDVYIGAIAIGGIIFSFIYMSFSFLRMGTTGLSAQSFGQKLHDNQILILTRSLFIAVFAGLFLIIFQVPLNNISFWLFDASKEVESLASQYFYIRVFAAPATISLYSFYGWFIGMQNTKYPMIIAISINVINIVLSTYFVIYLKMNVDGVAFGTLIAQYSGLFLAIALFMKKYKLLLLNWSLTAMFNLPEIKKFMLINKDIFIRTICLIIVMSFFTAQSAKINNTILAINTLLFQFFLIFSYFIDGFANAAEALVGKFIGQKNYVKINSSIKLIFLWGFMLSLFFTAIYFFFGTRLLQILTDNIDIINKSNKYIIWVYFIPLISFPAFIWDGIYVGATASVQMRNSMLISTVAIFFPAYYLLFDIMGNNGLWLSFLIFLGARGLLQTIMRKHI